MNILHQNNDWCNYRNKKHCLLGRECLSPNKVYQGKITSSQYEQSNYSDKVYFEVAEKLSKDSMTYENIYSWRSPKQHRTVELIMTN